MRLTPALLWVGSKPLSQTKGKAHIKYQGSSLLCDLKNERKMKKSFIVLVKIFGQPFFLQTSTFLPTLVGALLLALNDICSNNIFSTVTV
jgi:hypothetical protein